MTDQKDQPTQPSRRSIFRAAAATGVAAALPGALAGAAPVRTVTPTALDAKLKANVKNVVVIYLENRSFNNLFADFPGLAAPLSALKPADYQQRDYDGIVINPGALTHYSYALHDALAASEKPGIEIHVSDIHAREEWRRVSVTRPAVTDTVIGKGWQGYLEAVDRLIDIVEGQT